jgi:hypothetical protein
MIGIMRIMRIMSIMSAMSMVCSLSLGQHTLSQIQFETDSTCRRVILGNLMISIMSIMRIMRIMSIMSAMSRASPS